MRRSVIPLVLVCFTLCGCSAAIASKQGGRAPEPDLDQKLPYVTGLYLSPEIRSASVTLQTAEGSESTVAMGDFLRSALVRAAKQVFEDVVVLSEPILAPSPQPRRVVQEIWPDERPTPPHPEILVTCYAAYMKGHTQGNPECAACDQNLSVRAEIIFDIRNAAGDLLSRGRVSGHGLTAANTDSDLPLTAGFRAAMAEAVESLSAHFALALATSTLDTPAETPDSLSGEGEQAAERETAEAEM